MLRKRASSSSQMCEKAGYSYLLPGCRDTNSLLGDNPGKSGMVGKSARNFAWMIAWFLQGSNIASYADKKSPELTWK